MGVRAAEKMNGENNIETCAKVTDVDALGQELEFAAQEQPGQTVGQIKQQAGPRDEEAMLFMSDLEEGR